MIDSKPIAWRIESKATPGEAWEWIEGREPTEYEGQIEFEVRPVFYRAKLDQNSREDKMAASLREIIPAVRAYLMTGDVMTQGIKKSTWQSALDRALAALQIPA